MVDIPVVISTNPVPGAAQVPPASSNVSAVFPADQVVSGRVVQSLGSDQYVLAVRGRTLIASSQVPLATDSVVRMQLVAGGDTPSLRIIGPDSPAGDQAELSDPQSRLQVLGLPASSASSAALAAFEDAGAPLGRDALLAAVEALSAQSSSSTQGGDAAAQPMLASALAAVARAGLPATPATVALAMRAQDPSLPNAAGALAHAQALTAASLQTDDSALSYAAAPSSSSSAAAAQQTAPALLVAQNGEATGSAAAAAGTRGPQLPAGGSNDTTALRALLQIEIPDAGAGGGKGVLGVMLALSLAGVSATSEQAPEPTPGVNSAEPTVNPTLLKHLAAALAAITAQAAEAPTGTTSSATSPPTSQSLNAALAQALVGAAHESSASTVFKPAELADYDMVVAVPLQDQGQPTPTRLAVAQRSGAGGNATYLRVDTEMSHLGTVSVRLSGIEGSPLVITLLADGPGAQALSAVLPELGESLQKLGISAGLRVGERAEDSGNG